MKRYLTTEQRRAALKLAYTDRDWINEVDNMPAKKVYAIFDKLKKDGIIVIDGNGNISFRTRAEVKELNKKRNEARNGHQITLEEYMKGKENGKTE